MSLALLNAVRVKTVPHRPGERLLLRIGMHSGRNWTKDITMNSFNSWEEIQIFSLLCVTISKRRGLVDHIRLTVGIGVRMRSAPH